MLDQIVAQGVDDQELRQFADELQKPVTREDAVLGTLTLDRRLDLFNGKVQWNGRPITLSIYATEGEKLGSALSTARALVQDQSQWAERIEEFAVAELLPLKNDAWLEEDEPKLTPAEFRRRMKLTGITARGDGSFDFWHEDGDMFWGHSIQVSGDLARGPTDADIPG